MKIIITTRRATITDALEAHVHAKLGSILEAFPQVEMARVVLETQRFRHNVEVLLIVKKQDNIEARVTTDDMYKSIDQVADKLNRQLRRRRQKKIQIKGAQRRIKLTDIEPPLDELDS